GQHADTPAPLAARPGPGPDDGQEEAGGAAHGRALEHRAPPGPGQPSGPNPSTHPRADLLPCRDRLLASPMTPRLLPPPLRVLLLLAVMLGTVQLTQAQPGTDEQLAAEYMRQGEFDKAILYYEKLHDRQPSNLYYEQLLKAYLGAERYDDAEKLAKSQMRKQGGDPRYLVDIGMVMKLNGDTAKAKQQFDNALKNLKPDQGAIRNLANAFTRNNELDHALLTYE